MNCPECGQATEVIVTASYPLHIRRRRRCLNEHRFNTTEVAIDPRQWLRIKEAVKKLRNTISELPEL